MQVYHLLSAENGISDIALKRIRVSRVRDLNDPFELLAAKLDNKNYRVGLQSWRKEFNEKHGLLCFSKDWSNPVLWSHYAVKHRGICLGFELANEIAEEVTYVSDRMPLRFEGGDPMKGVESTYVRDLLTTKFVHWNYEGEVRVFVDLDESTSESGSYFYPFDEKLRLSQVILGPLCELPIGEIRSLVHSTYEDVAVFKASLAYKSFAVVLDGDSVSEEDAYWKEKSVRRPHKGDI